MGEKTGEARAGAKAGEPGIAQAVPLGPLAPRSDSLPDLCMDRRPKPSRRRCLLST